MITRPLLDTYVGHSIAEICPHGFDATTGNHCAHFVCHALQLDFGLTCAAMRGARGAFGAANIRVQETFARCPSTREIRECPTTGHGLIFVSAPSNFRGTPTQIRNVPRKHIGIVLNGIVWHYSNTRNRVVTQTVGEFLSHYRRQQNALWWGALPPAARPAAFGTSA